MAAKKTTRILHMTYGVVGVGDRDEYVSAPSNAYTDSLVTNGWAEEVKESDVPPGAIVVEYGVTTADEEPAVS